jgi:hypothetical protein
MPQSIRNQLPDMNQANHASATTKTTAYTPTGKTFLLAPSETFKGERAAQLEVRYEPQVICPGPPHYEAGLTVLAFLARDQEGFLSTTALSYGTHYPKVDERPVFRSFVVEAARLQQLAQGPARDAARIDWLERAASNPVTRWHGAYGLAEEMGSPYAFPASRRHTPVTLTLAQKEELAQALVTALSLGYTFTRILSLLAAYPSKA